jgi:hypothetical protein
MISNEFIHEFNLKIDTEYLKNKLELVKKGLLPHQNLVEEDVYLSSIKEQFYFLSPLFNVYYSGPGKSIPLHVDSKRNCAINIPIEHTEDSYTIFCKFSEEENKKLIHIPLKVFDIVTSPVEEVFKFTLLGPTLVNTSVPHKVNNFGNSTRIILSWSVQEQYTFEEIKNIIINTSSE